MKRMAEVADVRLTTEQIHGEHLVPPGVVVYEIAGPLFFGAAQKAMSALEEMGLTGVRAVVLDMRSVPVMDATGLVNLESAVDKLERSRVHVVMGGVQKQPLQLLGKSHMRKKRDNLTVRADFRDAIAIAAAYALNEP
jgi:SulP family sulfate permease